MPTLGNNLARRIGRDKDDGSFSHKFLKLSNGTQIGAQTDRNSTVTENLYTLSDKESIS